MEDMVNLTYKIGIPIKFNPKTLEVKYEENVKYLKAWEKTLSGRIMSGAPLWKSMMFAKDYTDEKGNIIQQPNLNKYSPSGNPNSVLYFGHQGAFLNDPELLKKLKENKLRPDVTVIPSGNIGREYIRTEGHEHISGFPEVYQNVFGENIFLLFKTKSKDSEDIEDVIAVFSKQGDIVLFPPNYQHISINIGKKPFVMTDIVSSEANSDFVYIKRHNGAPYWVINNKGKPEFIKNPRYKGKVPDIRLVQPVDNLPEIGFKKGTPIFDLIKKQKFKELEFLNDNSDKEFYNKSFKPYKK
jgi:glucose-6-phosphate isomerase